MAVGGIQLDTLGFKVDKQGLQKPKSGYCRSARDINVGLWKKEYPCIAEGGQI